MGHELHRELLGVLAFEACKVKFKSKGAHHPSLKKFWTSSTECFLKHLQAKEKKSPNKKNTQKKRSFLHFSELEKKIALYLKDTKIT